MMFLPWSFKILYGIIIDCVPLWGGSRRRAYLVLNSLISFLTLLLLSLDFYQNEIYFTTILMLFQLSTAFNDVTIDALMVSQSKRDKLHGSEEL